MKNKILFISFIIALFIVIGMNIASNNGEKYIGESKLYDIAINYIKEEKIDASIREIDESKIETFIKYDKFGLTKKDEYKYAYMWILRDDYYINNENKIDSTGYSMFFKFTFKDNKVVKYENPKDGSLYLSSLKKLCIDRQMFNKISSYRSKLNNNKEIEEYYLKYKEYR